MKKLVLTIIVIALAIINIILFRNEYIKQNNISNNNITIEK